MIEKKCKLCDNIFLIHKSRYHKKVYCSKECNFNDTHIFLVCKNCGKKYNKHKCRKINVIKINYCSDKCYDKGKELKKKNDYEKICTNCNKRYIAHKKTSKSGLFFCSQECSKEYMKGENSPSYNNGTTIGSHGYKSKKVDDKYILEHRIIMEKHLGRKLKKDEVVHHIDENKLNNNIENLELMQKCDHDRLHTVRRHLSEKRFGKEKKGGFKSSHTV